VNDGDATVSKELIMTRRVLFAGLVALGVCTAPAMAADGNGNHRHGVNARQQHQAGRIRDGVKDDSLTRGELNRLRGDEAAIRAEERVYRRSGDGLTRREYRDLQRDLNQTSREIYRFKHNDREPR
jgi:hypothetical protein